MAVQPHLDAAQGRPAPGAVPPEGADGRPSKTRRMLRVVSILLIVVAVLSLVVYALFAAALVALNAMGEGDLLSEEFNSSTVSGVVNVISLVVVFLTSALQVVAGCRGLRLARGEGSAESCQQLGIVVIGLAFVSWLLGIIAAGTVLPTELVDFLLSAVLPVFYYALARHEVRSSFWQGIKDEEPGVSALPAIEAATRYALDDAGMLRPAASGDEAVVELVGLGDSVRSLAGAHVGAAPGSDAAIRHCMAYTFGSDVSGTVRVPAQVLDEGGLPLGGDVAFAFSLQGGRLSIASDDPATAQFVARCVRGQAMEKHSAAAVLFELLAFTTANSNPYLFDQRDRLNHLEDNMAEDVTEVPKDFDSFVSGTRSSLRTLEAYYRQLSDLASSVAESMSGTLADRDRELFAALAGQAGRLATEAQGLCDQALQIREIYQNKIDVRQNKVMSLLTIVTTVFMPLSLITGWYGMNFDNMPELHLRYGYLGVVVLVVVIVTVEFLVFKRKKWF